LNSRTIYFNVVNDLFYIDNSSPTLLRWKQDRFGSRKMCRVIRHKGDIAGGVQDDGYHKVLVNGKYHSNHRVLYCLYNSVDLESKDVIDHVDGDTFNNASDNLRIVDRKLNSRNRVMPSNNVSGVVGVHWQYSGTNKYAVASWYVDNVLCRKRFSVTKLGEDEAFRLACECRYKMVTEIGSYTDRHGKEKNLCTN